MQILLVDNHTLFREGLKHLFDESLHHFKIDDCSTISEMTQKLQTEHYDLVLLEISMTQSSGIDELIELRSAYPDLKVAILSSEQNHMVMHRVIDSGAVGFIAKNCSRIELFRAVELICAGGIYLPAEYINPRPAARQNEARQKTSTAILACLSKRQREVLTHLLQGKPNKNISKVMNISENTVKAHMSAIFRTLGAHNRTQAVYYAAKAGVPLNLVQADALERQTANDDSLDAMDIPA